MIARSYEHEDIANLLLELGRSAGSSNVSLRSGSTDESASTTATADTDLTSLMETEDDSVKVEVNEDTKLPFEQAESVAPVEPEAVEIPKVVPAVTTTTSKEGVSSQTYVPKIASVVLVLVVAIFVALMKQYQED